MLVYIKKSFNDSKSKLSAADGKRVDKAIERLRKNPANPGLNVEVLKTNKDFSSIRVNNSIRVIFFSRTGDIYLVFVGQHDEAYHWGQSQKRDQTIGYGIVILPDDDATVPLSKEPLPINIDSLAKEKDKDPATTEEKLKIFQEQSDDFLKKLGVPTELIKDVQSIATLDDLFDVKVPDEVLDQLIAIAEGELIPELQEPKKGSGDKVTPPRESNYQLPIDETVESFIEKDFESWQLFLHPRQRSVVEGKWNGPVKITGPAGTGKTVVAVHRAKHLATRGLKVWVTTYNRGLANEIQSMLSKLCSSDELDNIEVKPVHSRALGFYSADQKIADLNIESQVDKCISDRGSMTRLPTNYLKEEWSLVFESQAIISEQDYIEADRTGRGRALNEAERKKVYAVFSPLIDLINSGEKSTFPHLCRSAKNRLEDLDGPDPEYDAIIVDEIQDLGAPEIEFVLSNLRRKSSELFLIGDGGQKIYPTGFNFKRLGIETRGRSIQLRCNYRTGRAIYDIANKLRSENSGLLGEEEEDGGIVRSDLEGEQPQFTEHIKYTEEMKSVAQSVAILLGKQNTSDYLANEIAIISRNWKPLYYMKNLLKEKDVESSLIKAENEKKENAVSLTTMHSSKGRTYRAVFIVNCSASEIPSPMVIEYSSDEKEKAAILERERNLLYVAMTRARDKLEISWAGEPSILLSPILSNEGN